VNLAQEHLAAMNIDGYWAEIDYQSQERGAWVPRDHLSNLLEIAKAYHTENSPLYQDDQTSVRIHTSLNYWLDNDFICPNWWYPVIGVPMLLNPIVLLMQAELSEDQKNKALKILGRCEIGKTGQNKVWLSGNVLLTSLFSQDVDLISKASHSIKEELRVSEDEGIQFDWSYHQHGPQLQLGNYGLSYAGDMIKWIGILRKTPYAFDENKVSILRDYLIEGLQWVIWKNQMNISSCGRQLFKDSQFEKALKVSNAISNMANIDPQNQALYKNANDYKTLEGNKHFWKSDYHIHRKMDYSFSVKMCSERVIGAESCNSENIQGYYMGDGSAFLYQTGDEYSNIFPFWDWKKVPGTTIHQDSKPLPVLTCSGYRIESEFVGGVSDGKNGIATMQYVRNGLTANKSWFMIDEKIVNLGSGITSNEGYPVTTSIEQSYLNGEVKIKSNNEIFNSEKSQNLKNPEWILHNNTGYLFPNGGDLILEAKNVEGSWQQVAKRYPDEKIHADIFKLWFDHGTNPTAATYEYIVIPNSNIAQLEVMEANNPFRISNAPNLQAVETADGQKAGFCFYKAGKANFMDGIEVDQACLLLIEKGNKGIQISFSDPTHKLSTIQLKLKGDYKHTNAKIEEGHTTINVTMPPNMDAGKSITLQLNEV